MESAFQNVRGSFLSLSVCEMLLQKLEKHNVPISFELPNSNRYWTHPRLSAFVQARAPFTSVVRACAMGIEGIPGLPIKKTFRIMSSSEELSRRLEKSFRCVCDFQVCQVFCANAHCLHSVQVIEAAAEANWV